MQYIKPQKKTKLNIHLVAFVLLSAFCLMKVYRGFSGEDAESMGGIWNYIQIFFVVWGLFFLLTHANTVMLNAPIVSLFFFAMFAFLFAVLNLKSDAQLKRIFDTFMIPYCVMMTIVFYEVGSRYGVRKNRIFLICYYAAALLLISAMATFYNSGANLEDKGATADVYYILGLLPLVLLYTPKKWTFLPIVICAMAVAFSGKRAALLAIVCMLVMYFYSLISKSNISLLKRIGFLILIIIAFIVLYNMLLYVDGLYNMNLFERMESLEVDGGSGRDRLWKRTFASIQQFDAIELFTGKGKGSVRDSIGIQAHNDFLHVLHEHGLFSVFFYIAYYILSIREGIIMHRNKYPHAHLFTMSLVCSLFIAMFSFYIIYPTYCTGGMVCSGFFMGDHYRFQQQNHLDRRKRYVSSYQK